MVGMSSPDAAELTPVTDPAAQARESAAAIAAAQEGVEARARESAEAIMAAHGEAAARAKESAAAIEAAAAKVGEGRAAG
jgi:hypothetical protein